MSYENQNAGFVLWVLTFQSGAVVRSSWTSFGVQCKYRLFNKLYLLLICATSSTLGFSEAISYGWQLIHLWKLHYRHNLYIPACLQYGCSYHLSRLLQKSWKLLIVFYSSHPVCILTLPCAQKFLNPPKSTISQGSSYQLHALSSQTLSLGKG